MDVEDLLVGRDTFRTLSFLTCMIWLNQHSCFVGITETSPTRYKRVTVSNLKPILMFYIIQLWPWKYLSSTKYLLLWHQIAVAMLQWMTHWTIFTAAYQLSDIYNLTSGWETFHEDPCMSSNVNACLPMSTWYMCLHACRHAWLHMVVYWGWHSQEAWLSLVLRWKRLISYNNGLWQK